MSMNEQENPFISFYTKYNISPVHQDISYFKKHLLRREKLYRTLGLPPIIFSNRIILEIGPGGGYNSLALFEWGANVHFVEPNPKAQKELIELINTYNIDNKRWKLFPEKIEEFKSKKQYDIVIAEGFIPGLYNRSEVIARISELVNKGGVVVVTCMDELSFFLELVKRLVAAYLIQKYKIKKFTEKVEILSRAFSSHLQKLKYSSRPVEDWVTDQFLNPALYGNFFSISDCIEEFGEKFMLLGSSPSMFTDYSWYKDIEFDSRSDTLTQFYSKRHVLILKDTEESVRAIEDNAYLVEKIHKLRSLAGKVENNLNRENIARIVKALKDISKLTLDIDIRISEAINEGISLLLDNDLNELKISNSHKLASAFGKGQQYVSLVKKFSTYSKRQK